MMMTEMPKVKAINEIDVIPIELRRLDIVVNTWDVSATLDLEVGERAFDIGCGFFIVDNKDYGKEWRAWTVMPTEEQRKAVKWNE